MDIPIVIICYNNYRYVQNTLSQLLNINKEYYKNIIIINNNSTCLKTIEYLNNIDVRVINNKENLGPWITNTNNKHIYDILPEKFILTDPDLKFNKNIPKNFIEILANLSDKYKTSKIGFALDISDHENFFATKYTHDELSIYEWEKSFYELKIADDEYELYEADIDTTFCLINKKNIYINKYNILEDYNLKIRVGGNFTAKHIPWYIDNEIYNVYDNYINNINTTSISSISKIISTYIENKYLLIYKNKELFLIENNLNNPNLSFWKDIYYGWKNDTFEVIDKYLSKDKVFIDIGGWIAATSMYVSRKSKHVYTIEADNLAFNDMKNNLKTNCENNYTIINKAIYDIDNKKVNFGKNFNYTTSRMNDSRSLIYPDGVISDEYYIVETITLETIIKNYDINIANISLINVDIVGGEENILDHLFDIHIKFDIPLYIHFHYCCWNDKNLDRFSFLSEQNKKDIIANPFISIFF
jgi:FkbM family methyltransferase